MTRFSPGTKGLTSRDMAPADPALWPPPDTALWTAVRRGSLEKVGKLLAEGADIEEKGGEFECTALQAAIGEHWRLEPPLLVRLLLDNGADVDARDKTASTPLHYAALFDDALAAELLLAKGADVSATSCSGQTPRQVATRCSHLQISAMIEAEEVSRAKELAFAMGLQERLGAASCVNVLDEGVVRLVLEHV